MAQVVVPHEVSAVEMPLEEALAAYQEGNELVKYCQTKLAEVEQKLQVLDADGLKELTLDADE